MRKSIRKSETQSEKSRKEKDHLLLIFVLRQKKDPAGGN